jgi:hypothetical protein
MRPLVLLLAAALVLGATTTTVPADARGKPAVEWKSVSVPDSKDSDRVARTLRSLLVRASRKADFGHGGGKVVVSARVVQLAWEDRGDVVRLSCTVVGRVEGGPSARSRISFGAARKDRAQLEKQVLTMVANGVVTRLAEIARTR